MCVLLCSCHSVLFNKDSLTIQISKDPPLGEEVLVKRRKVIRKFYSVALAAVMSVGMLFSGFGPVLAYADDSPVQADSVAASDASADGSGSGVSGGSETGTSSGTEAKSAQDAGSTGSQSVSDNTIKTDGQDNDVDVSEKKVTTEDAEEDENTDSSAWSIWIGSDEDTTFDSLSKAVEAAGSGDEVHIRGDFTGAPAGTASGTVNKSIVLVVSGDTVIPGSAEGITLASGSSVRCENGGSLTFNGGAKALTVSAGAEMNDGTYYFKDAQTGLDLKGAMRGSSRSALKVTIDAKNDCIGLSTGDDTTFSHATFIWHGGNKVSWTYRNMTMEDVDADITNVWLYPYPLDLKNCTFRISGRFNGTSWRRGHVMSIYEKAGSIVGSDVTVEGSRINVINDGGLTIKDSTVTVKNSPDGGFNVNYGSTLRVSDSVLRSDNVKGAFIAAGYSSESNLLIDGSSVVDTAASTSADSIGADGKFVVTGGSYNVHLGDSDKQIPTNGEANGNEKLTLFRLKDPSVESLSLVNKNGETYTYPVARANSDGAKRVWAPKEEITFTLGENDSSVDASFADGSSEDITVPVIRGMALEDATYANGTRISVPDDPSAAGFVFAGWYYKDENGTEHKFDPAGTKVSRSLTVYARWNEANGTGIVYHRNIGSSDVKVTLRDENGSHEIKAADFDTVSAKNGSFRQKGWKFTSWNTKADGTGTKVMPGETVTVPEGSKTVALYAQYEPVTAEIRFSANGGTFTKESIFKTNTDAFSIEKDRNGGDVAVLKVKPRVGTKLSDALSDAGISVYNLQWSSSPFAEKNYYKQKGEEGLLRSSSAYYYFYKDAAAEQRADFYDAVVDGDTTYYVGWEFDESSGAAEIKDLGLKLPGDILVGGDSADTHHYPVNAGDKIDFTGRLKISPVKDQIRALAGEYEAQGGDISNISTEDVASSFIATFRVPLGMSVEGAVARLDSTDVFDIPEDGVSFDEDGRTVTVTMELKKNYTSFRDLYDDITGMPDYLNVTLSGVSVDSGVAENTELRTVGSVTGTFRGTAKSGQSTRVYNFKWTGEQDEDGLDFGQDSDDKTIAFTAVTGQKISTDEELLGDILFRSGSDADTQHTSVYKVNAGEVLDYTGRLTVKPIKDRIDAMKNQQGDTSGIATRNVESGFTAVFKLPEGMSFEDNATASLDSTDVFYIPEDGVTIDRSARTITVKMVLRKDYSTFDDLYKDIMSVPDDLNVVVSGVRIGSENAAGTRLTVLGTLDGYFSGLAVNGSKVQSYDFKWHAVQDPDGRDSTLPEGDETISATAEVQGGDEPEPETPAEPGSMTLTAQKYLDDKAPGDARFTFVLEDENGNVLQRKENDASGKISFDSIEYTSDDVGRTFTYTVYEESGNDDGYVYDSNRFTVTVTPRVDESTGKVTAEPVISHGDEAADSIVFRNRTADSTKPGSDDDGKVVDDGDKDKTHTNGGTKSGTTAGGRKVTKAAEVRTPGAVPKTGDDSKLPVMILVFGAAAAAALVMRKRKSAE
jgi:pilin isopeptide linkage protein/uncharacterized repeat protein (TIGR02543 family)